MALPMNDLGALLREHKQCSDMFTQCGLNWALFFTIARRIVLFKTVVCADPPAGGPVLADAGRLGCSCLCRTSRGAKVLSRVSSSTGLYVRELPVLRVCLL